MKLAESTKTFIEAARLRDEGVKDFYREFGKAVKKQRVKMKLSQHDLGSRVGLSRTSITHLENGTKTILLHDLYMFAGALETSVGELLPS